MFPLTFLLGVYTKGDTSKALRERAVDLGAGGFLGGAGGPVSQELFIAAEWGRARPISHQNRSHAVSRWVTEDTARTTCGIVIYEF